ncbi:SRA-YDG [Imleria badia]|nr:SRA-YDG [Imleria badia]
MCGHPVSPRPSYLPSHSSPPTMSQESRIYGHIPGVRFGDPFKDRDELMKAGVHGQRQAGIHGDSSTDGGAFSICISGGYKDDKDMGDKIIYVGAGGRDKSGKQIKDQSFDEPGTGNESLRISSRTRRPVRVIRGGHTKQYNGYAPASEYRYDGLYFVDSATMRRGKEGYNMCFFELRTIRESTRATALCPTGAASL